ncbi:hypothetical protein [Salinicola avicenniae]|uniref:hypothetical protein n=1 Tax=Salinicola avicenniae TaxID=2916836 RepID=UPI00207374E0|nr:MULTISPECIES: hypothetical protein [unclassified Salinicola]
MRVEQYPQIERFIRESGAVEASDRESDKQTGDNDLWLLEDADSPPILVRLERDRVVLFAIAVDLEGMDLEAAYRLLRESLGLNRFHAGSLVRYALEEEGRFLIVWNEMPLQSATFADLGRYQAATQQALRELRRRQSVLAAATPSEAAETAESARGVPVAPLISNRIRGQG